MIENMFDTKIVLKIFIYMVRLVSKKTSDNVLTVVLGGSTDYYVQSPYVEWWDRNLFFRGLCYK
jgi:hypothetical protein